VQKTTSSVPTLTGPNGVEASSSQMYEFNNREISVPAGNYTVTISGNGATTGAFSFRVVDLSTAQSFSYGDIVSATPATTPLSVGVYSFNAAAGDQVFFSALSTTLRFQAAFSFRT
jgi:hypothetical protein